MSSIPNETLENWIVEDLTDLYSKFDDERYSIFDTKEDLTKLDHIADNIKSLVQGLKK